MGFGEFISDYLFTPPFNLNQLLINIFVAIILIIIGIILGRAINAGLKRLFQKLELNKKIRGSFVDLFLVVIRWSIYIIFISLGLNRLEVPVVTTYFTNILITIPAFTGALVILALGFAIAIYLRDVIEDAEVTGWDLISKVVFYFVLFIFGVYAIKTALISFDESTTNIIIVILTAVVSTTIAYIFSKNMTKREHFGK